MRASSSAEANRTANLVLGDSGRKGPAAPVPKGPKIMIVDDQSHLRRMLFNLLTMEGYAVFEAVNGLDCLNRLSAQSVDLVLLDLKLPLMDGVDVTERLRKNVDTKEIPILIMTGFADRTSVIRLNELGASGFVVKPFDVADLLRKIKKVFETRKPVEMSAADQNDGSDEVLAVTSDKVLVSEMKALSKVIEGSFLGSDLLFPRGKGVMAPAGAMITAKLLAKARDLGIENLPVKK